MNKTFKVARSLTRGCVVTSEASSSYQGKALKTVVAVAAAMLMAGGVAAATGDAASTNTEIKDGATTVVIEQGKTGSITENAAISGLSNKGTITGKFDLTLNGTNTNEGKLVLGATDTETAGANLGDLTVSAGSSLANKGYIAADEVIVNGKLSTGILADGNKNHIKFETLTLNQGGSFVVDALPANVTTAKPQMVFTDGTINFNGGSVAIDGVADNSKIDVTVGNESSTVNVNFVQGDYTFGNVTVASSNGNVTVGAKDETLNKAGNPVTLNVNSLTLSAGKASIASGTVNIATTLDVKNGASLTVSGGSTTVKDTATLAGTYTQTAGTTTFEKGATVTGTFSQEGGTIVNKGAFTLGGTVTLGGDKVADSLFDNTDGVIAGQSLTIGNGQTVRTKVTEKTYMVGTTNLEKGGVIDLVELNSTDYGMLITGTKEGAATFNLNGGKVTYNGAEYTGDLKVGSSDAAGVVTFGGDYNLDTLYVWYGKNGDTGTSVALNKGTSLDVNELKIVRDASKLQSVTINGTFAADKLTFTEIEKADAKGEKAGSGSNSIVTVAEGAEADIGTLTFANADDTVSNSGTMTIKTVVTGEGVTLTDGSFANTGTLYTDLANLVKTTTGEKGALSFEKQLLGNALGVTEGKVIDNSTSLTLTVDELAALTKDFGGLVLTKASLVKNHEEGGAINFADLKAAVTSPATTAVATVAADKSATLTTPAGLVLSNVDTSTAETVKVDTTKGALTLAGNGQTLFGTAAKTISVTGTNGLTLGYEHADNNAGSMTGEVVIGENSKLNVDYGNWAAQGGIDTTTNGAAVNVSNGSTLDAAYINGTGTIKISDGVVAVLGTKPAETETSVETNEAQPFADAVKVEAPTFEAGENNTNIFVVGTTAEAGAKLVADAYGEDAEGKSVFVLTKQLVLGNGETAYELKQDGSAAGDILVDMKSLAANTKVATEGVIQNSLSGTGTVTFANYDNRILEGKAGEKTLKLAKTGANTIAVEYGTFFYGNGQSSTDYSTQGSVGTDGKIKFELNDYHTDLLMSTNQGVNAKAALENVSFGQNKLVDTIVFGLPQYIDDVKDSEGYAKATDKDAYLSKAIGVFNEQIDIASEMAALSGAFSTALDINDQTTAAINRRLSLSNLNVTRNAVGMTPWVDVFGTTNEAKTLYGDGAGYEADIYGAVLGFDYTASCGGVLGVALNIGTADANSKGIEAGVDSDTDFYGLSIYGAKQFGSFNVMADFGYTQTKNDLSMSGVIGNISESQDADVTTFGIGTEFLASAGAVNVVPHAGIRYTRIDMDESEFGADYDAMGVWQMPLGVAFSGTFETNGWNIAPMADIAVVPTFGDKNVEFSIASASDSFRVIDSNPVQATLGVNAQNGAFTFGLNYRLTAGSDDRMNNSFNANVRYTF